MDNIAPISPSPTKPRRKLSGIALLGLFCGPVLIVVVFAFLKCFGKPALARNEADGKISQPTVQDAKRIQHEERYCVLRGNQNAEVGGISFSDLREILDALYEGQISHDRAKHYVFTFEAQCSARVDYVVNDYAICSVMGGGRQPFAIEIDGSESELFSGQAIRYVDHKSFTTRNGTVRIIPIFKSVPNVKPEEDYDDSQYEAIKPN